MSEQDMDELADWLAQTVGDGRNGTAASEDESARIAVGAWRQRTPGDAGMRERMLRAVAEGYRTRPGWRPEWKAKA